MRVPLLLLCVLTACATQPVADPMLLGECDPTAALFGEPNAKTGLTSAQCQATCACSVQTFTPPTYTASDLSKLRAFKLRTPIEALAGNPYDEAAPTFGPDTVCGVKVEEDGIHYSLQTYDSSIDAAADHAQVTHGGPCGVCSDLEDLAVYIEQPDLTEPVRACGLANLVDDDALAQCIAGLGFTEACTQIWAYNTRHTQGACATSCFALIDAPYQNPDGSLNDCLQCDEDKSGPVFKAIAGRTRRNSGLANALCRPCEEVLPIVHHYSPARP